MSRPVHPIVAALTARRRAVGLSQRQLAQALRTSQAAISEIERGATAGPSVLTLERLAHALDCDLSVTLKPRPHPAGGADG